MADDRVPGLSKLTSEFDFEPAGRLDPEVAGLNDQTQASPPSPADQLASPDHALAEKGGWRGTASELLALLNSRVPDEVRRDKRWPKAPHALSGRLKREAPDLRELGWAQVRFSQEGHSRMRTISISPVCMEEEKERPQRSSVRAEFEMSGSTRSRASAERPHPAQERPQLYLVPDEDDPPIEDDARPAWLEQEVGPDEIPPPEEVPWSWLDDEEAGT